MAVDPEYLKRHYASLSDEALLAVERADLVDAARKFYDDELGRRDLTAGSPPPTPVYEAQEQTGEKPDWLEDAMEVYSTVLVPGGTGAQDAGKAREALTDEGIPCYLDLTDLSREPVRERPQNLQQLRLLVPGGLNLHAASVLDREIFNPDFENEWKSHLESFTDEELRDMHPQVVFCGLFDRVERVTRAWSEEMDRRGLEG